LFNQDIGENKKTDFRIFPNPVVDNLNFESSQEYHIELLTIKGKVLLQKNSKKAVIQMGNFPKGIYLLRISNDKKKYIRKIVKR
jgi:hypothetical protein